MGWNGYRLALGSKVERLELKPCGIRRVGFAMPVLKCRVVIVGSLRLSRVIELEVTILVRFRNIEHSFIGRLETISLALKGPSILKLICSDMLFGGLRSGSVGLLSFLGTKLCDVGHSELLG